MIKNGLKLRSINIEWFEEARRLIETKVFDFIELYIVPEKFDKQKFEILKGLPISFHAPHGAHGFNPVDVKNNSEEIWGIILDYVHYLDPFAIVLHPERSDDIGVLNKRLGYFGDHNIFIENMPMKSVIDENIKFYGYCPEHIKEIQKFHNGFCFDFAKAKSAAVSQGLDPQKYILDMIDFMNPNYFHISGFKANTEIDEHDDLRELDLEMMKFMKDILVETGSRKDIFVVFECRKKDRLENDVRNVNYFS